MPHYAMLILPSFNNVYTDASGRLLRAELELFNKSVLGARIEAIGETVIAGVTYVKFFSDHLSDKDVAFLSNASSLYALFQISGAAFVPVTLNKLDRFSTDLVTIQKYRGKTNSLFTKLLMNVTLLSTAFAEEMISRKMLVCDPLCGRGTTLNQALMYGYDTIGMEIDPESIKDYSQFVTTWLKKKLVKHKVLEDVQSIKSKNFGRRFRIEIWNTKELYKKDDMLKLNLVNDDTIAARKYFKADTLDAVVCDLPYGVLHGSRAPAAGLSRRPLDLLEAALPVWIDLLKPGGAIGLSWNTHVAGREKVEKLIAESGPAIQQVLPPHSFRHTVDQSIVRDIIILRKP